MRSPIPQVRDNRPARQRGMTLALVVASLFILAALGVGLLTMAYGARHMASVAKAECASLLAAEAGYEKAVFWMSQQQDMLSAIHQGASGTSGSLAFPDSSCTYQISLYTFVGSRPVYRVASLGRSGVFSRKVDVFVVQAVSGWDMGTCRIPSGATSTTEVYFATGETIDMPIHINKADDNPDVRDLNIFGTPSFLQSVTLSESQVTTAGADKYGDVLSLFSEGIYFDQPNTRITDESSIQVKVDRFRTSTKPQYCFTPVGTAAVTDPQSATQIEFYEDGGVGKVRITNDCTVRTFQQNDDAKTYDFKIRPGTNGQQYTRYGIYAYHVAPSNADATGQRIVVPVTDTYVTQSFNGSTSAPGGQIFVNGNVILGGQSTLSSNDQVLNGQVTIIATGNIWIADSVCAAGTHDSQGQPSSDNPNVLGLMAQGVIKVVDPGLSTVDSVTGGTGFTYVPIGEPDRAGAVPGDADYKQRHLPAPTVVEAAITVGGGGWVRRTSAAGPTAAGKSTEGPRTP